VSETASDERRGPVQLGLRSNAAQFALLVAVNALVGGMLGRERTVLPLLADREFGLSSYTAGLSFIVVFGLAKAAANYFALHLVGPVRPQTRARRGLAARRARPAPPHPGADMGLGAVRQRAARSQPGTDLVDHGGDEDRR
jgi:hypothetical protein